MLIISATESLISATANSDPLTSSSAQIDRRFAEMLAEDKEAKDKLSEITRDGAKSYWEWKIKEMRKQIGEEVMGEMNLTPEKIAAMSAEERVKTETKILEIVEQRLRLAIAEEMKRKQNTILGFNASATAILSAQEITAA